MFDQARSRIKDPHFIIGRGFPRANYEMRVPIFPIYAQNKGLLGRGLAHLLQKRILFRNASWLSPSMDSEISAIAWSRAMVVPSFRPPVIASGFCFQRGESPARNSRR